MKKGRPPLEPRIKALEQQIQALLTPPPGWPQPNEDRIKAVEDRIAKLEANHSKSALELCDPAGPIKPYQPLFDRWPAINGSKKTADTP